MAEGAPGALGAAESRVEVRFRLPDGVAPPDLRPRLDLRPAGDLWEGRTSEPVEALHALCAWALERGIVLEELEVRRPSLEDVYLELTARAEPAEAPA